MQLEVSSVEKSRRRTFLPLFVLSVFLNLAPIAWTPCARAQTSSVEGADGEISGTVLLESDKRPASQVTLSLKSRAAGIVRTVLTDLEGHFKVRNLPRGTYDIAVDDASYEAARTSAQLDGTSAKLVLYLKSKPVPIRPSAYSVSVRQLAIPRKAQSELQKGLDLGARNDPVGSLPHFTKAIQIFPGYFEAYYNSAVAYLMMGRTEEAAKAFQTAIDLSGGRYALAEFGYGYLLCQEGRPAEAEKIIRRGLEAQGPEPQGYVILGEALKQLNRLDEAEQSAHEALLRNPNYASAYLVLSEVAERKGDYLAQIQDLDTYLTLQPNGPTNDQVRQVREGAQRMLAKVQPRD